MMKNVIFSFFENSISVIAIYTVDFYLISITTNWVNIPGENNLGQIHSLRYFHLFKKR